MIVCTCFGVGHASLLRPHQSESKLAKVFASPSCPPQYAAYAVLVPQGCWLTARSLIFLAPINRLVARLPVLTDNTRTRPRENHPSTRKTLKKSIHHLALPRAGASFTFARTFFGIQQPYQAATRHGFLKRALPQVTFLAASLVAPRELDHTRVEIFVPYRLSFPAVSSLNPISWFFAVHERGGDS